MPQIIEKIQSVTKAQLTIHGRINELLNLSMPDESRNSPTTLIANGIAEYKRKLPRIDFSIFITTSNEGICIWQNCDRYNNSKAYVSAYSNQEPNVINFHGNVIANSHFNWKGKKTLNVMKTTIKERLFHDPRMSILAEANILNVPILDTNTNTLYLLQSKKK